MRSEIAEAMRMSHAELQKHLGNPYVAYNATGLMLPTRFYGLAKDENYSNYSNRRITTDANVSFLQKNYYVARSGEPESKMRVWRIESRMVQGQKIGTIIHTTSLEPQAQLLMTANGLFAI
jgi:hypothetical protein